jgi:hypothetical protein
LPLHRRWAIKTDMGFSVAIVLRRAEALVGLRALRTRFVLTRVQVLIPILARTRVTPFRVGANSILVTIVGVTICTFILIHTLAFPVALVEPSLAFARTIHTNSVLELGTVRIHLTSCRLWRWRLRRNSHLGGRRAFGDAISDKVVDANTNCRVGRRYNAGSVLVTNEVDTHIPWNTLERTPIDWNKVLRAVGENGIEATATTALEFLRGVVVNTE